MVGLNWLYMSYKWEKVPVYPVNSFVLYKTRYFLHSCLKSFRDGLHTNLTLSRRPPIDLLGDYKPWFVTGRFIQYPVFSSVLPLNFQRTRFTITLFLWLTLSLSFRHELFVYISKFRYLILAFDFWLLGWEVEVFDFSFFLPYSLSVNYEGVSSRCLCYFDSRL